MKQVPVCSLSVFIHCARYAERVGSGAPGKRLRNETQVQPGVACTQMVGRPSQSLFVFFIDVDGPSGKTQGTDQPREKIVQIIVVLR
jgi:hypothetical protein